MARPREQTEAVRVWRFPVRDRPNSPCHRENTWREFAALSNWLTAAETGQFEDGESIGSWDAREGGKRRFGRTWMGVCFLKFRGFCCLST